MALTRPLIAGRASWADSGSKARPGRALARGLLAINALVVGLAALLLTRAWLVEMRDAEIATLNVARLVARDIESTLDRVNVALSAAVRDLQGPLADGTPETRALAVMLAKAAALVPEVRRIVVFDADGHLLCAPQGPPCPAVDLADRQVLARLRRDPGAPPSLHGPYVSRQDGQRWIALLRGVRGPDGALVGVAAAAVSESTLRKVLLGIDLGPQGAVSLLDGRLKLLARAPEPSADAQPAAGNTVSSTLHAAIAAHPVEGTSRARSGIDGIERVAAYRQLPRHGAYVAVGQASRDLLASWWLLAVGTMVLLLMVGVGSLALLRLSARAHLREQQARRLYDQAPCGYHTLDAQGRYRHINDTELSWLGCSRDEVVGRLSPADFFTPEGRAVFAQRFPRLQQDGSIVDLELQLVGRDGRRRQVLVNAQALHDDEGHFIGSNSVMHDITALRQAEQQRLQVVELQAQNDHLQATSRQRDEFVANLSHELRTPLNAVLGFTQILQSGRVAPDSPRFARHLAQIGASGRHLLQVIDTMLGHAKSVSDQLPIRFEPVHVRAALDEAVALMHDRCAARDVTLQVEIDSALDSIDADPLRLRQVLLGLLDNAVKFSPRGARVQLRAQAAGSDDWVLEVEDAGIGIAEADLPLLFTPYRQLSSGSTKTHGGLGLGLALVQRLVQAHGGRIGVTSRLGQGSVFRVQLPRRAR